ncbi:Uma2 family endonuclease [Lusitaniella coriacea]|nr:Uma2 family endonuclease [Lusitaniella coriacea]
MSSKPISIKQTDPPLSPKETLPTMYDLPSEDPEEPGLPDEYHDLQPALLRHTFNSECYSPEEVFIGADMNIYYDVRHPLWHKRPDWFLAVGVPRLYEETDLRLSYVVWQEGVNPLVIVELLSPGTAKEDLGDFGDEEKVVARPYSIPSPKSKWEVYEQVLRIPYYIVFDRYTNRLWFFQLVGTRYQLQELDPQSPQIWIPELQLGMGLWEGEYEGITRLWLRWRDAQGNWIPTPAQEAQQKAQEAQQQAQEAQQRAEAAERSQREAIPRMLNLGLSIEQVAEVLGLTVEEVNRFNAAQNGE